MRGSRGTISPRTFSWRRYGLLLAAGLAALLIFKWQAVLSFVGGWLVDSQPPQRADLILILGGDFWGPRVIKGADLALLGYAPIALISSPPYYDRPEGELAVPFLVAKGYPREMFAIFPHTARSTITEALVLRGELERRGAKQVLLVTSAYHSRRAAIVFSLFCPGIHFISVSADDPLYEPDSWWKKDRSRAIFLSELLKMAGTVTIAYPAYLFSRWKAQHEPG